MTSTSPPLSASSPAFVVESPPRPPFDAPRCRRLSIHATVTAPPPPPRDRRPRFDFAIVASSWLALGFSFNVSVLRLVRLLRVFKVER